MAEATALDVSQGGSILVAGNAAFEAPRRSSCGCRQVVRLDTVFGNAGSTVIDLPSEYGTFPVIHDIAVQRGKVLIAGGDGTSVYTGDRTGTRTFSERPFVARLLADGSDGGPGVLGVPMPYRFNAKERDAEAVVTVRRTGGRAGRDQVCALQTQQADGLLVSEQAVAGQDFTTTARTLTWEDGDHADKQVAIPVRPDPAARYPRISSFRNCSVVRSGRRRPRYPDRQSMDRPRRGAGRPVVDR